MEALDSSAPLRYGRNDMAGGYGRNDNRGRYGRNDYGLVKAAQGDENGGAGRQYWTTGVREGGFQTRPYGSTEAIFVPMTFEKDLSSHED